MKKLLLHMQKIITAVTRALELSLGDLIHLNFKFLLS